MPGALGFSWHESNRGEYLAQYFLAALGVSAPVIRQEDIGIDFYCALARQENKRLTFHSPFMVQHGATKSKAFLYGRYNDADKKVEPKWGGHEIEWLFSQELPLFVCTTDLSQVRFRLYSTSPMWLIRYQFGNVTQVEFCPDEHHDILKESKSERVAQNVAHGDGFLYRVPLGNPIVDLTVADTQTSKRESAIHALSVAISVEQQNLTWRNLSVHCAKWLPSITPNEPQSLTVHGGSQFWSNAPGANTERQLEALLEVASTLALNFEAQGATERLKQLLPVFALFRNADTSGLRLGGPPHAAIERLLRLGEG